MRKILISLVFLIGVFSFLLFSKTTVKTIEAACSCSTGTSCDAAEYPADVQNCGVEGQIRCCTVDLTQAADQGGGAFCCQNAECGPGYTCEGAGANCTGGNQEAGTGRNQGHCQRSGGFGGGGGTGSTVNSKCNCTGDFGACGDYFGKTNIQYKTCTYKINGTETCNLRVGLKLYKTKACDAGSGSPTPTPTGGNGENLTPTPPPNPNCVCGTTKSCSSACTFEGGVNATSVKCSLSASLFQSTPTAENAEAWCQRPKRTIGDANGDYNITNLDYMYYVSAVNGGKIPTTVNPDFNGDGEVGASDRTIIIGSL